MERRQVLMWSTWAGSDVEALECGACGEGDVKGCCKSVLRT